MASDALIAINLLAISALLLVLMALEPARRSPPLMVACAAVLATGAVTLWWAPTYADALVALVFGIGIAAPVLLAIVTHRAASAGRDRLAAVAARAHALLQPTAATRFAADFMAALAARASLGSAEAALEKLQATAPDHLRPFLAVLAAAERFDYDAVLRLTDGAPDATPQTAILRLRALGELGRIDDMWSLHAAAASALPPGERAQADLFALAFSGRPDAVDHLLRTRLRSLGREFAAYWIAVAQSRSITHAATGLAALRTLSLEAAKPRVRTAARSARTRAHPPGPPSQRTAALGAAVAARTMAEPVSRGIAGLPLTLALTLLIVAVFAWQWTTGRIEDARALLDAGALWPAAVIDGGEWWRLVTAPMLHAHVLHAAFNLFAVMALASGAERQLGIVQTALVYVLGAVGSTAAVLALMLGDWIPWGVLVGASGAIMALFGAITAEAIRIWLASRDPRHLSRLAFLAAILAIQVVVDVSIPAVSFSAHASGFLIGLVTGAVLAAVRAGRSRR